MVRILESEILDAVFGLDGQAIRDGAVHFPKSAKQGAGFQIDLVAMGLDPSDFDPIQRTKDSLKSALRIRDMDYRFIPRPKVK